MAVTGYRDMDHVLHVIPIDLNQAPLPGRSSHGFAAVQGYYLLWHQADEWSAS